MAEIKWIKITTDIFDDEKIRLIDSLPEHDAILVIWFKILTLAGRQGGNGLLMMNNRVHYTEEMLATLFNRPLNTIRLALQTFEQFGMIEITDGVISLPNWEKHQNVSGMEKIKEQTRQRVARHRENQKKLASGNVTSNVTVTQSNATEEEREEDKNKKENKNKNTTSSNSENLLELFQSEFRRMLSGYEIEEIKHLSNENDNELIKEALKIAINAGKPNIKYICGILRNWEMNQITTIEQVKIKNEEHSKKNKQKEGEEEWGF